MNNDDEVALDCAREAIAMAISSYSAKAEELSKAGDEHGAAVCEAEIAILASLRTVLRPERSELVAAVRLACSERAGQLVAELSRAKDAGAMR